MKVSELIELLQKCDQQEEVYAYDPNEEYEYPIEEVNYSLVTKDGRFITMLYSGE